MAAAVLAVRLASARTSRAISGDGFRAGIASGLQVLAHDRAHERARPHRADFEQPHLLACQAHLRNGIVDHDTKFGMGIDLKRIGNSGSHDTYFWKKNRGGGSNAGAIVRQQPRHINQTMLKVCLGFNVSRVVIQRDAELNSAGDIPRDRGALPKPGAHSMTGLEHM